MSGLTDSAQPPDISKSRRVRSYCCPAGEHTSSPHGEQRGKRKDEAARASGRGVAGEIMAVVIGGLISGRRKFSAIGTFPEQAQDENRMHLYHGYKAFPVS